MIDEHGWYRSHLSRLQYRGLQALRLNGIHIDRHSHQTTAPIDPSTDNLWRLVVRPPPAVIACVQTLQERLRAVEPNQNYPAPEDLYLDIFEIRSREIERSSRHRDEAMHALLEDLRRLPYSPRLIDPQLICNPFGYSLAFCPAGTALRRLRESIRAMSNNVRIDEPLSHQRGQTSVTVLSMKGALETTVGAWIEIAEYLCYEFDGSHWTGLDWTISALDFVLAPLHSSELA
jgi:hypothetical protein